MTEIISGWLLDVYPNETNLTVWLIGEDGRRLRFVQDFTPAVYAAGPSARLRELWRWITGQALNVRLSRTERRDVFRGVVSVLSVEVLKPIQLDVIFHSLVAAFPDLTWYDADISVPLRYMAAFDLFPLAHCRLELTSGAVNGEKILNITALDTPWELDPAPAPLRILSLEPDCDPAHAQPKALIVSYSRSGRP